MMNKNVFVKPNGQSRACASYAMAKKRLLKTNLFLSILFLLAAGAAGAQEPPVTEAEIERQEQQRARETTEQRVEQAVEGELQELLERIPDSLRVDKWIPGTVVVDGHILEPVPLHKPEMERWSMPAAGHADRTRLRAAADQRLARRLQRTGLQLGVRPPHLGRGKHLSGQLSRRPHPLVPSAAIKPTLADLRKSRRTDTPAAFVFLSIFT